eukprot:3733253-Rhodomonas_salina.3
MADVFKTFDSDEGTGTMAISSLHGLMVELDHPLGFRTLDGNVLYSITDRSAERLIRAELNVTPILLCRHCPSFPSASPPLFCRHSWSGALQLARMLIRFCAGVGQAEDGYSGGGKGNMVKQSNDVPVWLVAWSEEPGRQNGSIPLESHLRGSDGDDALLAKTCH